MISGFFLRSDRNLDSPWRQKSRTTKNINCNNKTLYSTELTCISGCIRYPNSASYYKLTRGLNKLNQKYPIIPLPVLETRTCNRKFIFPSAWNRIYFMTFKKADLVCQILLRRSSIEVKTGYLTIVFSICSIFTVDRACNNKQTLKFWYWILDLKLLT